MVFSPNRRDYLEIVAAILRAATHGAAKTRIQYTARLNYSQTKTYLAALVTKGLIKNTDVKRNEQVMKVYRTTETGLALLDRLAALEKLLLA